MMGEVIGIVVTMDAKPEKADALAEVLTRVVTHTRTEEGCIMYDLHRQLDAPERFVVFERWSSEAALAAHIQAAAAGEDMKAMGGLLASRPSVVKLAPIAV